MIVKFFIFFLVRLDGKGGGGLHLKGNAKGKWDQFKENERLFGVKTSFDENLYTTAKPRLSAEQEAEAARLARGEEAVFSVKIGCCANT